MGSRYVFPTLPLLSRLRPAARLGSVRLGFSKSGLPLVFRLSCNNKSPPPPGPTDRACHATRELGRKGINENQNHFAGMIKKTEENG
jgi:hypothetical protein